MNILSLLNDVNITHYGQTFDIALSFIGELIKWLIGSVGVVGVGIMLFSLILKLIVLPFDIYQRVSMRKQNQKMKENQEKLAKLQKQYANDKEQYNQKMMEFYKANGISMVSSCLPMILSMVIFFVAIGAFNSYAQYANINNYNVMVQAYNQTIESYTADIEEDNIGYQIYVEGVGYQTSDEANGEFIVVKDDADANKYIYLRVKYDKTDATITDKVDYVQKVVNGEIVENGALKTPYYVVDVEKTKSSASEAIQWYIDADKAAGVTEEQACANYFRARARMAVETAYEETVYGRMNFLWIANIWQTDASYKHPVLSYSDFISGINVSGGCNGCTENKNFRVPQSTSGEVSFSEISSYTQAYDEKAYDEITANLSAQKSQPNGYFILIALSIVTILLQQWLSMRSQKEQSKYSSVDGQGGSQQKMMLIIMTVMFGFFSFLYSAAFSIYMVISNLLSLASMFIINKLVDIRMDKLEQRKLQEQYNKRFPGRGQDTSDKKKKKK